MTRVHRACRIGDPEFAEWRHGIGRTAGGRAY